MSALFVFSLPVLILAQDQPRESQRYNVLFITVDDLNNDLGTYGHQLVKSPNIDRLAARGMRFDRAYNQYPLCNPSRASLLTGMRPDSIRVYNLQTHFREALPNVVTLPQLFKESGWFSARVGKIYHMGVPRQIGEAGLDDPPSWNLALNPAGVDKNREESKITKVTGGAGFGASLSWYESPDDDLEHTDGKVATEAIRLLEENKNKPFFLAVGFFRPHTPYVAPKKYFDLYPIEKIQLPKEPADDRSDIPPPALNNIIPPNFGLSEEDQKRAIRAYYASISFMDAQVGRVLDALDRLKLADNTIIVFCGDHGYSLANHGLWMKQNMFEEATRTPLIVVAPPALMTKSKGGATSRLVEFIDIYPTLAELAKLPAQKILEGKSFKALLDNPKRAWKEGAYSQVMRNRDGKRFFGRSVRTERWRYTEWHNGKEGIELYDHKKDPHEFTNLANNPKYSNTVKQLKALLQKINHE